MSDELGRLWSQPKRASGRKAAEGRRDIHRIEQQAGLPFGE
jgi:hypothetical protein